VVTRVEIGLVRERMTYIAKRTGMNASRDEWPQYKRLEKHDSSGKGILTHSGYGTSM
jgi:hypothetical protein